MVTWYPDLSELWEFSWKELGAVALFTAEQWVGDLERGMTWLLVLMLNEEVVEQHPWLGWAALGSVFTMALTGLVLLAWTKGPDLYYFLKYEWMRIKRERFLARARAEAPRVAREKAERRERAGRDVTRQIARVCEAGGLKTDVAEGGDHCRRMFAGIKLNTHCIFAAKANVLYAPDWVERFSLEENFLRAVPLLLELTAHGEGLKLDGMVFYCPGSYSATVERLGDTMAVLLWLLDALDPAQGGHMRSEDLGRRGWRYKFNDTSFFVTSFGPCYASSHPRFCFGHDDWTFILFQPSFSFSRNQIGLPNSPIRLTIREAFAAALRPFWSEHSPVHYPFIWNFVSPILPIDPLVLKRGPPDQWWLRKPILSITSLIQSTNLSSSSTINNQ